MKHKYCVKDCVIFPRQAIAKARNGIIIDNGIVRILGMPQFELSTVLQDDKIIGC